MGMSLILGIDPGSRKTGYGLLRYFNKDIHYIESGCIQSTEGSLVSVFTGLQSVIKTYQPTEMAIEQVFFHRYPKSALVLGQARGVALLAAQLHKLPIKHYAPRQIKQAMTGYGAAKKEQMQYMMQQLLKLSGLPSPDAADALSIALCHIHHK